MQFYCWAKSFCNRRRGWVWRSLWEKGYWFFFYKAYDAIDANYGEQSGNAW
jgi:hypothetical protein